MKKILIALIILLTVAPLALFAINENANFELNAQVTESILNTGFEWLKATSSR